MTAFLDLQHLEKSFGETRVVKDFNLGIAKGEFVSLLGPSGCGKTTVLRMIAGFETPSSGAVIVDGKDVTGLRPNQRNVGMVFQAYALFPNLTVAQNVGFGLKVKGVGKQEAEARVAEMLAMIGLPQLGGRYPFQLSGGQQQRVALARALAPRPQLLLLDEPLSALDAKIRVSLRQEIRDIQRSLGITTIFVTHDQEEALSMSDRIVVMNGGIAEQAGSPFDVYNRPATRFVAQFVGTLSLLPATVTDVAAGTVSVAGTAVSGLALPPAAHTGAAVSLALRPESLRRQGRPGDASLSGIVRSVDFLGSVMRTRVEAAGEMLAFDAFNDPALPPPQPGDTMTLHFAPDSALVLPA
ncbi:MAG: ABC transporter ATP-binding protein [Rhizobiaceae bacterium]|nr:ABC transporter ATP-binding protein [Rhizobiaceae bacterium]